MTTWHETHGRRGRPWNQDDDLRFEQRHAITEAALRVATRRGLSAMTIRAVADEARVRPGIIHYHCRDKEQLLHDLVASVDDAPTTNRWYRLTDDDLALRLELIACLLRGGPLAHVVHVFLRDIPGTLRTAADRLTPAGCEPPPANGRPGPSRPPRMTSGFSARSRRALR